MFYVLSFSGSHGAYANSRGLLNYADIVPIDIFPTEDDGGSTGRLKAERDILGVGEITGRLCALSQLEEAKLLNHRYVGGENDGHTEGNLKVADCVQENGTERAIKLLKDMYRIERGEIIPVSLERFVFCVECEDGSIIEGEHNVDEADLRSRITKVYTRPNARANPKVLEYLEIADMNVFGPTSHYSSLGQILAVEGIPEAIRKSKARQVYVANLMTTKETKNMNLQDHLESLESMIGARGIIDTLILNDSELPREALEMYAAEGQFPIDPYLSSETRSRVKIVKAKLLSDKIHKKSPGDKLSRSYLRHGYSKLARVLHDTLMGDI